MLVILQQHGDLSLLFKTLKLIFQRYNKTQKSIIVVEGSFVSFIDGVLFFMINASSYFYLIIKFDISLFLLYYRVLRLKLIEIFMVVSQWFKGDTYLSSFLLNYKSGVKSLTNIALNHQKELKPNLQRTSIHKETLTELQLTMQLVNSSQMYYVYVYFFCMICLENQK